jgi:Ca2+-binding EF-hand superfamily protein
LSEELFEEIFAKADSDGSQQVSKEEMSGFLKILIASLENHNKKKDAFRS